MKDNDVEGVGMIKTEKDGKLKVQVPRKSET
jgi:hypothetical protein